MTGESGNAMPDDAISGDAPVRVVASVRLTHEGGLHARPAIKVTQLAKRFASRVWLGLSEEGPWVDAKSVARVIGMKTPSNVLLFFAADGHDANDAVGALVELVDGDFGNA
jgi:phosphocarrier protein HPr